MKPKLTLRRGIGLGNSSLYDNGYYLHTIMTSQGGRFDINRRAIISFRITVVSYHCLAHIHQAVQ